MKKSIALLVACLCLQWGSTQPADLSGLIVYEHLKKININLPGEVAGFTDLIPKERKTQRELLFNTHASLYRPQEKVGNETAFEESAGAGNIMIRFQEANAHVFTDLKTRKTIEQREFLTRRFLIENRIDTLKWKLTENKKEILGYPCFEAILLKDPRNIKAWFTHEIPVSTGPDGLGGLPGLILAIESDEGQNTIIAKQIEIKPIHSKDLNIPRDGKKLSRQSFDDMVRTKTKEMESAGEGGVYIIRRN